MATCNFNSLYERDMDLMLLESIISDKEFTRLLVNAKPLHGEVQSLEGKEFEVENVELSNYDADLGESDLTVILTIEGVRYGFLIEDKINAVAMPNQYQRYVDRAEKAKAEGIYSDYRIFIFCPTKYHDGNAEAGHYDYHLSYEDCRDHFAKKDDPMSRLRVQQLQQAIDKSKSSNIVLNDNANKFFKEYAAYQKEHFPELKLTTKLDKNGYWPQYKSAFKGSYILHKFNFGCVDLQISNAAAKIETVERIVDWLITHGCNVEAVAEKGVKSAIIRCRTHAREISKTSFKDIPEPIVEDWFKAISLLTGIAKLFANIKEL